MTEHTCCKACRKEKAESPESLALRIATDDAPESPIHLTAKKWSPVLNLLVLHLNLVNVAPYDYSDYILRGEEHYPLAGGTLRLRKNSIYMHDETVMDADWEFEKLDSSGNWIWIYSEDAAWSYLRCLLRAAYDDDLAEPYSAIPANADYDDYPLFSDDFHKRLDKWYLASIS